MGRVLHRTGQVSPDWQLDLIVADDDYYYYSKLVFFFRIYVLFYADYVLVYARACKFIVSVCSNFYHILEKFLTFSISQFNRLTVWPLWCRLDSNLPYGPVLWSILQFIPAILRDKVLLIPSIRLGWPRIGLW